MKITEAEGRSEREPMQGRVVLITGGAAGTGLEIAKRLDGLGATVVVGTRNLETQQKPGNFSKACEVLSHEPTPFIADLTQPDQVSTAISSVREKGIAQFTDVISCAAGGIEKDKMAIGRILAALRRSKREKGEVPQEEIDKIRGVIEGIVLFDLSFARDINVVALQRLIGEIREGNMLREGGHIIQLSSLPSSFFTEGVPIPSFYKGVAQAKHEAEVWLTGQAQALASEGLTTTIISGDVIGDSAIGDLYKTVAGIFYPEEVIRAKPPFITKADMAGATIQALRSQLEPGEVLPRRIYVLGDPSLSPLEILKRRALPL